MYSQIGDISYKRLTRTINVPAGGATLSFWTSYDTELHWDHLIVEAHTAGQDDWTTLPDLNGHTSDDPGDSCPAGWRELHPFLDHYQTLNADGTCTPTGTTGAWNAASGASGGWQQWPVDLAAYAGGQVEISIAYVSDWAIQGLGVFLDDIEVSDGLAAIRTDQSRRASTSFEVDGDPMDGWAVTGPPAGSAPNPNNFVRTRRAASRRAPWSPPTTPSTWASASRASRRLPREPRSCAGRWTTCCRSARGQLDPGAGALQPRPPVATPSEAAASWRPLPTWPSQAWTGRSPIFLPGDPTSLYVGRTVKRVGRVAGADTTSLSTVRSRRGSLGTDEPVASYVSGRR